MDPRKIEIAFFFLLFAVVGSIIFFMFRPFLGVLFLAGIFAVALSPLYEKIVVYFRGRRSLAGVSVLLGTVVFIALPLFFLGGQLFKESRDIYFALQRDSGNFLETITGTIERPIQNFLPDFTLDFRPHIGKLFGTVAENLGPLVSGTAELALGIFLFLLALFYFLKDGREFTSLLIRLSPLSDRYDEEISERVRNAMGSVLKGTLLIAGLQGLITGVGLAIFGVPNIFLWGSVAAVFALIPGVGTALVIIPAVIYLVLTGSNVAAVGLALWGAIAVGLIDNILAPLFYGKKTNIHPLFMLLSVLGGLTFFGPLGLLFGPILLVFFFSLIHIYQTFVLPEET